jgi:hypothetical protein
VNRQLRLHSYVHSIALNAKVTDHPGSELALLPILGVVDKLRETVIALHVLISARLLDMFQMGEGVWLFGLQVR